MICSLRPAQKKVKPEIQRAGGGATIPHALIKSNRDVRAEADFAATNLVRFCAVHIESPLSDPQALAA
jgi:hypothetical protein